jgi:hypothetical protein
MLLLMGFIEAGWGRTDMEALASALSMIAVKVGFGCTTEMRMGTAVALKGSYGDPVISQRVWLILYGLNRLVWKLR